LYLEEWLPISFEKVSRLVADQGALLDSTKLFDITFWCVRNLLIIARQDNVCKDTVSKQTSKVTIKRISESFCIVWCLHQESNSYPSGESIDANDPSQERDVLAMLGAQEKGGYHDQKVHARQDQQIVTNVEI
jgi:hypothetical protein